MQPAGAPVFWKEKFWNANPTFSPRYIGDNLQSVWLVAPDRALQSGFIGPFGGFWANSSTELDNNFQGHLSNLERLATDDGFEVLRVRLPPLESGLLHVVDQPDFVRPFGWAVVGRETDHLVNVSDGLPEFSRLRKRDIARGKSLGYRSMSGLEYLDEALKVVELNRHEKRVPLTVNLTKAKSLVGLLGKEIRVSVVKNIEAEQTVAGSLSIMVQEQTGYVIQWGHIVESGSNISPMAMLASEVFSDLMQNGAHNVLLGSSSVNGIVNPGLARFKESLGAASTPKWLIEKALS